MMTVRVEEVRVIKGTGSLKGFADVRFGVSGPEADSILMRGFTITAQANGALVVLGPRKASKDGRWFQVADFGPTGFNLYIKDRVLEAYEKELAK